MTHRPPTSTLFPYTTLFRSVGFENLNIRNAHGVSFDRCTFYHSFQAFNSSVQFRGCGYDGQHAVVFSHCAVGVPGERIYDEEDEFAGHAETIGVPTGNPPEFIGGDPP